MNKFLTTLAVALFLGTAVFAQEKGSNEFSVNVGYNASTVTANGQSNSDYRNGLNVGVSLDHYFSESWSLKGRLVYDQKGWDKGFLSFEDGNRITTNYRLDYLTVPVLASWHFGRTKNWYLQFGPYVGFLLNGSDTESGRDIKNAFNSTDVGVDFGIGIRFPVSERTKLFIELNGAGGFNSVFKQNAGSQVRNSTSAINVGFAF